MPAKRCAGSRAGRNGDGRLRYVSSGCTEGAAAVEVRVRRQSVR